MKIFNFFIYLLIIARTLFSCKKNTSFDMCKICGEWNIKSDAMETGEILIFNTDNNFTYKSVGPITESFSQGNWKHFNSKFHYAKRMLLYTFIWWKM